MNRAIPSRPRRRESGFTLIELLTAIAIFTVLAGMLFQMLKSGLDIWRQGEGNRQALEKGINLLDEVVREIRMAQAFEPAGAESAKIRMLVDYESFDLNMDDIDESSLQRIRFVRSCPEERTDNRLRLAGDWPGGERGSSDVVSAAEDADVRSARPTGGLAEVAYATMAVPSKVGDPGLLTLYRMFRTPIGRDDSIFADDSFDDPKKLDASAVAVAENVLHFGVKLWSRDTRGFDVPVDSEFGPLSVWDSTRGHLLDSIGMNHFRLAKDETSLDAIWDDVFPRRVLITLVVEADQDEAGDLRLTSDVSATSTRVKIDSPRAIDSDTPFPYLKIEGEWVKWSEADAGWLTVERGVRGSSAVAHLAGATLHLGRTFQRVVDLPVYREDWNDE